MAAVFHTLKGIAAKALAVSIRKPHVSVFPARRDDIAVVDRGVAAIN
jgi:hypothetical protein